MNDHDSQNALVQAFERLDFSDTNTIMQLGHHAQVNISMLSESVLSVTKSMRTQEIYSTLEQTIDDLLVFPESGGFLSEEGGRKSIHFSIGAETRNTGWIWFRTGCASIRSTC